MTDLMDLQAELDVVVGQDLVVDAKAKESVASKARSIFKKKAAAPGPKTPKQPLPYRLKLSLTRLLQSLRGLLHLQAKKEAGEY